MAVAFITLTDFQSHEMLNNALNAQWFIAPVAILILCQVGLTDAHFSRSRVVIYTLLIALIGMSAPLLLLVSPFAVFVLIQVRRVQKIIPATFLMTCAVQGLVFSSTAKSGSPDSGLHTLSPPEIGRLIVAAAGSWTYRDILSMTIGFPGARYLARYYGELLPGVLCVLLLCAAFRLGARRPRSESIFLISWITMCLVLVAFSLVARNLLPYFPDLVTYSFFGGGQRYFAISGWMFLVATAIIVENYSPVGYPRIGAFVLLSMFGMGVVINYQAEVQPDRNWRISSDAIETWRRQQNLAVPHKHLVVPIFPDGWMIDLPAGHS
jgi:hypothetical protein